MPNFSEGRDTTTLALLGEALGGVPGCHLLHVDPGPEANRTVFTLAGEPTAVVQALVRAAEVALRRIDMRQHRGTHPRLGALDVCPLVPLRGLTLADAARWAHVLGQQLGQQLGVPVYMYEAAATAPHRQKLAQVRAGEYEGLPQKMTQPGWQPDYGPHAFHARAGAWVVGARPLLAAYNVTLTTTDVAPARAMARVLRETGYTTPEGNRVAGRLSSLRAIGWYLPKYGAAQVSMNLTDLNRVGVLQAYLAVAQEAQALGLGVAGSEIIGMIPEGELLTAGRHWAPDETDSQQLVQTAINHLGLQLHGPFNPEERLLEWKLRTLGIQL